jgi:hypothetical protein
MKRGARCKIQDSRSEERIQKRDARYKIPDTRYKIQDAKPAPCFTGIQDTRCKIQDAGVRRNSEAEAMFILEFGTRIPVFEHPKPENCRTVHNLFISCILNLR